MRVLPGLFLLVVANLTAFQEIESKAVFGLDTPTGRYKHPSAITELQNGDLYLVYFGGDGEYSTTTAVYGSRKTTKGIQWTEPVTIARDPFRSVGNAVVWQSPDGLVWLFYVVRFGDTWSTSRIAVKVSRDNAETWSDSHMLTLDEGMMVRNRPIVLSDGDYLLPAYQEFGNDTESVSPETASVFFRYNSKTKQWSQTGRIRSSKGNLQPAVVETAPNRLLALCRRGGNYESTTSGYIIRAESNDGGNTWSDGIDSDLPNPNAAIDLIRLKSGRLMLVFNDSMNDRTPLTAAFSEDNGKSFPVRHVLRTGKNSFAYPMVIQTRDQRIHLVYTSNNRTVINHAVFRE